jgi:hypothetical protein
VRNLLVAVANRYICIFFEASNCFNLQVELSPLDEAKFYQVQTVPASDQKLHVEITILVAQLESMNRAKDEAFHS